MPVFAGTFYFLALLNPDDEAHEKALAVSQPLQWPLVTTYWILTELGDALAASGDRKRFLETVEMLRLDRMITIEPLTLELFDAGMQLFNDRPDKDWSLTECISFGVMKDRSITKALTGDHHFEQAGFTALLK